MVRVDVRLPIEYTEDELLTALAAKLPVPLPKGKPKLLRLAVEGDAKSGLSYKASVGLSFDEYTEAKLLRRGKYALPVPDLSYELSKAKRAMRPVVVGSGPCGLFAALSLAEAGLAPILLERGEPMEKRKKAVDAFLSGGELNEESNIQFGEGGAGTFSDGKLKPGAMDARKFKILSEFVAAGAPERILYDAAPHVGTDILREVILKIRKKAESLGATVLFGARLCGLVKKNGKVVAVRYEKDGKQEELACDAVVLAAGHSAADVFELLKSEGVPMEARGFGMGVRIEHPREYIDRIRYGENPPKALGAASYHLVEHLENGRSAYSFCMCPGGTVVAATPTRGSVVTNGMSLHARDGENSNAAFLVSVTPRDFGSNDVLAGLAFQRKYERLAYELGGDYRAPVQLLGDFVEERESSAFGEVKPTYGRGTVFADLRECLPDFVSETLRNAIPRFDMFLNGFYLHDAVMTGVETRSTSPVRILRGENGMALTMEGLYPCGEGAGYAGGILSSAVDGLRAAEKIRVQT